MASDDLTKGLENGYLVRILAELGEVGSELKALDNKVEALDNKVEVRLKDTRPLWEGIQSQLKELRDGLRGDIEELRGDMHQGFLSLRGQIAILSGGIVEVRATHQAFDKRLATLEK